ncbi:ABC transporter ATP-binding protein [Paramesorhizobium deserti]|uniref:ABC transporter ATP-binding protein n=1 Tax=Paramesorhizobium deserti TaxID=1494590 RepID=A0A135I1Z1_9HYPH|nr:ABC transporter ATP-binding protein [Paramesorhizobium deserti]KXF79428.1 ABC transporter ATP-binding protein [Paramesorhizobium deserti]
MIGQKLILSSIEKRYGEAWAVREFNLQVAPSEFISIVGPSGSGKTSLLTMIAGFEMPSAGTIRIGERDVTTLAPNKRDIGMVFQKYALFPHLTVRQNIAFPLKMRSRLTRRALETRVEEMLLLVQLEDYGGRYPNELSGGQQQRVAVARALVFDPPVILMDEPLGALDKKLREDMQFEIKRIQERHGATVIYVTHDQEEALTMSDRIAVMHQGRLQQVDTPEQLYRQPISAFVADFIGTMNFVPAMKIAERAGKDVVRLPGDTVIEVDRRSGTRSPGEPVGAVLRLAVRPEHIALGHWDKNNSSTLAGVVETSIFVGSAQIVLVRLKDRADVVLRVQRPAGEIARLTRGDLVEVKLDGATMLAFTGEERRAA